MLTRIQCSGLTVEGISIGGVHTTIQIPELDAIFDAGMSPRSFAAKHLFLSHAHADHVGALPALIGVRGLSRLPAPRTFIPEEAKEQIRDGIEAFNRGQHRSVELPLEGVKPGQEFLLYGDLWVRVFRTIHSIPSVGYELFRKVKKLKKEFLDLPPQEIAHRRKSGEDLFSDEERSEVAYSTDTLIDVLDQNPRLYRSKVLILECTFLDDRKSKLDARKKSHVHLDEILERAELFENEHLVLMHFSQIYSPSEVRRILKERVPEHLAGRIRVLGPEKGPWPG